MLTKSLFYRSPLKLLSRAILVFVSFYVVYLTIVVFTNFSYFLILAPIVVVLIFTLSKRLLLEINIDESNQNIEFVFLQFIFFKRRQIFYVRDISYSYQEERTSRLAYNYVFRVFCNERLVFSRYHDLDGMNQNDVENIMSEFKLLDIQETYL